MKNLAEVFSPEEQALLLGETQEQEQTEESSDAKAQIVCLADIEPEPVFFLWPPYIIRRKLNLFEGDPGIGKTYLALQIATIVTRGSPWPNPNNNGKPDLPNEPGNVLYMSAEDGLADTLRPRLDDMGADLSRFYALIGSTGKEGKLNGVTLADLDVLEDALQKVNPVLIVIDPLQGYLGARVDMHRANEVRPVLTGLAQLAEKYNAAVLCIRHLTKGATTKTMYRGMGSIDFSAAARSVIMAGADPNNPAKRAIFHIKSSLAANGPAIGYTLTDECGFGWTGLSDLTPEATLAPVADTDEKSALDEAIEYLNETLSCGSVPSDELLKEAKRSGISDRTLHRAKKTLGVVSRRIGGKDGKWQWELPEEMLAEDNGQVEENTWKLEI